MEITNGLKRYWRRKRYQRIDGAITKKKTMQMARLGGKRKRTWRIRVVPKLKLGLKCVSPMKLLARLRDGYIHMMVGIEGKVGALNGDNFFGAKRLNPKADRSSKVSKAEEFEAKLIFEIYKSLMASRQLASQNSSIKV